MTILVSILAIFAGCLLLLLLLALFIRHEYLIEREIIINRPREVVFNYLKFLKNQDHYSKWVRQDPLMQKSFRGEDGTPGFVYAWDSQDKNAGKGEQEIISIAEGEKITVEVRFEKPFKSTAQTYQITELLANDQTRVKWGMAGNNAYPLNLMNLAIDKILGKDLEQSLHLLKQNLEAQPRATS